MSALGSAFIFGLTMFIRLALIALAIGIGIAVVHYAARKPLPRRADDPAADPHAAPYGELPGFSCDELKQWDIARQRRGERGLR